MPVGLPVPRQLPRITRPGSVERTRPLQTEAIAAYKHPASSSNTAQEHAHDVCSCMPAPTSQLGACSWSLQPPTPDALVDALATLGLTHVQLHLDPIRLGEWDEEQLIAALDRSGVQLASGMMTTQGEDYSTLESIRRTGGIAPDSTWTTNLAALKDNARLAARLGVRLVSLHAGHLAEDPSSTEGCKMIDRLNHFARVLAEHEVQLALETGQETAETLVRYLDHLPDVRVNFDPANMLLYSMGDPLSAFDMLAPHIVQVHIKDAVSPARPGTWGTEVPVGTGEVDWTRFIHGVRTRCPHANMMIEREAGDNRLADMQRAIDHLTPLLSTAS